MTDLSSFFPLFDKSEQDVYDEMAANANLGLDPDDPAWEDTRVGSPFYMASYPMAIVVASAYSRMNEAAAAAILSTSWGPYLDLHALGFGTERKAAVAATGQITILGSVGTLVGTGARMAPPQTDPDIDPPTFETTGSGAIPAALATPGTVTPTGSAGGLLVNGTTYRYVVTALDSGGGETLPSAEASFTAGVTNKTVSLAWAAVPGAVGYRVYRKVGTAGPPWDFLGSTSVAGAGENGSIATDATSHPPTVATSGTLVILPIQALEEGVAGNVAAGTITDLQTAIAGVASITNALPLAGGAEVETDSALKGRLEAYFEGQGGGNKADYKRWALEEPGVGRVTVVANWDAAGDVLVILMTDDGRAVAASVVASVQTRLDPNPGLGDGQAPIDHAVTVTTPAVQLIDVTASPTFLTGYSLDGTGGTIPLRAQIESSIRAYVDALEAGDDVIVFQLRTAVGRVKGVKDLTSLTTGIHPGALSTADIAIGVNPAQVAASNVVTLS